MKYAQTNPSNTFNKSHEAITSKVTSFLTSQEAFQQLSSHLVPMIEKPAKEFVAKNQEKIPQYMQDQELLLHDIEEQIPLAKYLNSLLKVLDALFIASTIASIVTTVLSLGAATPATLSLEAAKAVGRKAVTAFVKKEGKALLKKLFSKAILKEITKVGLKGVTQLSKFFLKEAAIKAGLIVTIDSLLSVVSDITLTATKNLLLEKGVSEFHLPKDMVVELVQPQTSTDAFKRILSSAKDKIETDLKELFTTQEGFKSLAYGAALRKLWQVLGTKSLAKKMYQKNMAMSYIQEPSNSSKDKYLAAISKLQGHLVQQLKNTSNKIQDYEELLKKSFIPQSLYSQYTQYINQAAEGLDDQSRIKKAEAVINSADLTITSINDSLYELVMIDFVRENKDKFSQNPELLNNFIRNITDIDNMSMDDLLERSETSSFDEAFMQLYKSKILEINSQLEKVALSTNPDLINKLRTYFMDKLNLKLYKSNLYKETFGEQQR